jgi:1,4-alpha-glucan branching enzyme
VVLNLGPEPREEYRLGVPLARGYYLRISSQDLRYGGSAGQTAAVLGTEPHPAHGRAQSIRLDLPALAALIFVAD